MDGIYKLLDSNLVVVIFLVVDSSGFSEVGRVGLLANEQKEIQLNAFKTVNKNPKIGCFMTDKDMKKRDVIKTVFSRNSNLLVPVSCPKNIPWSFQQRQILSPERRKRNYHQYSDRFKIQFIPKKYEENYKILSEKIKSEFKEYFDKIRHSSKEEWVTTFKKEHFTI